MSGNPRAAYSAERRAETVESCDTQLDRTHRTDLGLELAAFHAKPGVPLSLQEIALWAGCSNENIRRIEVSALRKIRKRTPLKLLADLRIGSAK